MFTKSSGLLALAAVVSVGISPMASAADLPLKAVAMPAPSWNWTGFYAGVFAGAGWGTTETSITSITANGETEITSFPVAQNSRSGFLGGGQIGYNFQSGWAVVGIEGDFAGLDVKGTTPCIIYLSCTANSNWLATASGRIGGVFADRALIYVKGGAAWMNTKQTASVPVAISNNQINNILGGSGLSTGSESISTGALLGMGAEYMFDSNWSAFIEYDYMEFAKKSVSFGGGFLPENYSLNTDVLHKLSVAKIGLNYKFGGPVVAKY